MSQLEEWLALAPPPQALEAGRRWHVFLSYRSTERKWTLALYDILAQLGYSVFMDQFVLVAGAELASSLGENLEASQSGVLVWSTESNDSAWCKKEYNSFEARHANGDFPFVAVRLQNATLPSFVQGALWLDASDQRDGPRGTSLLRLLYGLQNKPLPPEGVRLAARIDATTANDLATLRNHANARNAEQIVLLAKARQDEVAWQASPVLSCAAAQALISMGAHAAALTLLESVRAAFPAAIRPRQLTGLALARSRKWQEARAVLGELYELGERDAETVGLYARTWMDAYEASGDRLLLRRSRDLYAQAFAMAPSEFYPGINAAAKSVFLDDLDTGVRLAKAVEQLLAAQPRPGDYWHAATVAEAQLIQGNFDAAASGYAQAVATAPGAVDDHRSTCKQARLLLTHLAASPEQVDRVVGVFRREVDAADAPSAIAGIRAQGQARVVTFVGFSGTGYENEDEVRDVIVAELAQLDPGDTLVCAGATPQGIGMVYPIALQEGFRTAGIVSSRARKDGAAFSSSCEILFVVSDPSWGGKQDNGRLSATSRAMVGACDLMIGIGGGAIARDELESARDSGKTVRFHPADMNHELGRQRAARAGEPAPQEFGGEAAAVFAGR